MLLCTYLKFFVDTNFLLEEHRDSILAFVFTLCTHELSQNKRLLYLAVVCDTGLNLTGQSGHTAIPHFPLLSRSSRFNFIYPSRPHFRPYEFFTSQYFSLSSKPYPIMVTAWFISAVQGPEKTPCKQRSVLECL